MWGEGIHRRDVYEIPPSAIREIIVNAVAHRNYVNGEESPITVALYNENKILSLLWFGEKSKKELADKIGIAADANSLKAAIRSLLEVKKYIEQTKKDKPMSRLQKYRLTSTGISYIRGLFLIV